MKIFKGILFVTVTVLLLAACGRQQAEPEQTDTGKTMPVENRPETTAQAPVKTSESASLDAETGRSGEGQERGTMTKEYGDPVDIWANATLNGTALGVFYLDENESWRGMVVQERYDILKELKQVKAYPADDFTPEKMTYPLVGLTMGSLDNTGSQYLYTNGYMLTQDGKAYRVSYDFTTLFDRVGERNPLAERGNVADLPCGFLLAKDSSGAWIRERLPVGTPLPAAEGVTLRISKYEEDLLTLNLKNSGKESWVWGYPYTVETFLDGGWYRIPVMTPSGQYFDLVGFGLEAGETKETEASLLLYKPLPAGKYRIVKTCFLQKEQQEAPEEHYMAAEFTVTPQGEIEY